MLTLMTQTAIAALYDIGNGGFPCRLQQYTAVLSSLPLVLEKLSTGGLICCNEGSPTGQLSSYSLCRAYNEISLLDILEAMYEHLNCIHPICEEMYQQYHRAASRLGIINHITRFYLSDICLTDL